MISSSLEKALTSLKLEIYSDDNKFTEDQQKELSNILNTVDTNFSINKKTISNIWQNKAQKQINEFEQKYIEYGGNKEKLEVIFKEFLTNTIPVFGIATRRLRKMGIKI